MLACNCPDWKANIDLINGPIILQQVRNPSAPKPNILSFRYCPWCATPLKEEESDTQELPLKS